MSSIDALVPRHSIRKSRYLVNNAELITGIVSDVDLDALRRVFEVNVFGVIHAIQSCIPTVGQGYGHIVNTVHSERSPYLRPRDMAINGHCSYRMDGLKKRPMESCFRRLPGSTDTEFRQNELQAGSTLLAERPRPTLQTAERAASLIANAISRGKREVFLSAFSRLLCTVGQNAPRVLDYALARTYHK